MNNETQNKQPDDSNDTLTALLKLAGPSAEIDRDIEARVYANVRREWSRGNTWLRPARWAVPLALAASILIAFGLNESDNAPQARAIGAVTVLTGDAQTAGLAVGDNIFTGDVLDTSNRQGLSLLFADDISVRLDADTLLRADSASEFTLLAGRVYIDTGDRIYADRHVTVNTASGTATDIGTQFSVGLDNADMSVAVREGQVDLKEGGQVYSAMRGEKVTVRPGKAAQFDTVSVRGEEWDWAVALAPTFDIENKSVLEFLKWVSRETGMALEIESDAVRMETMRPRLHGSVDGMSPLEALDAVLATTQFEYSIEGDTITVRK